MNVLEYFNSPICARLAVSLAHFLWQGLAIALLTLLVVNLFAKNSSRARYVFYVISLFAMILSLAVTYSFVDVPVTHPPATTAFEAIDSSSKLPEAVITPKIPRAIATESLTPPSVEPSAEIVEKPESTTKTNIHFSINWHQYVPYAMVSYCLGVLVLLVRLLIGLQGGQRLRRFSQPVDDSVILAALTRQAKTLRLKFTPAVACCRRVVVPTVVGVLKPTILLPLTFTTGLTPGQMEMLLAHELAHIRRYDPLVNIAQGFIEALLFFHPAVWFISRRIRIERENCCDDMVLEGGGKATEYASSLVEVAQQTLRAASKQPLVVESVTATGLPSRLGDRIRRLMGTSKSQQIRLKHTWVIASLYWFSVNWTFSCYG